MTALQNTFFVCFKWLEMRGKEMQNGAKRRNLHYKIQKQDDKNQSRFCSTKLQHMPILFHFPRGAVFIHRMRFHSCFRSGSRIESWGSLLCLNTLEVWLRGVLLKGFCWKECVFLKTGFVISPVASNLPWWRSQDTGLLYNMV